MVLMSGGSPAPYDVAAIIQVSPLENAVSNSGDDLLLPNSLSKEVREAFRKDALSCLIGGLYSGAIFPFVGFIARDRLHASAGVIGLMSAAPFVGSMLALFWAKAMCGKRKMPFTAYTWAVARFFFVLMVFARTPLIFALMFAVTQIGASLVSPPYAVIMKLIYPDDRRGRLMSYCRVGGASGAVLATFAVGPMLQKWGDSYRVIIPLAGVVGIISTLIFSTIKVPEDDNEPTPPLHTFLKETLGLLRTDRAFSWFCASVFVYGIGNLLLTPIFPIYQVDVLHIKATELAILMNMSQIVWMFSYMYWGPYVDRRTPLKGVLVNILLTTLVPLNYMFAHSAWALAPAFVVSGIVSAGTELAYFNSILYLSEPERTTQYQGLFAFLLGVRGTIAPFLAAAMKDSGVSFQTIFLISLGLMIAGACMQAAGLNGRRGSRAVQGQEAAHTGQPPP